MMDPERWQHVKQVLANALELPRAEREAYLNQSYAEDTSLRDDLEPLVAQSEKLNTQFLGEADLATAVADVIPEEEISWVGQRVGPYLVVELIGAGGMGEVYR